MAVTQTSSTNRDMSISQSQIGFKINFFVCFFPLLVRENSRTQGSYSNDKKNITIVNSMQSLRTTIQSEQSIFKWIHAASYAIYLHNTQNSLVGMKVEGGGRWAGENESGQFLHFMWKKIIAKIYALYREARKRLAMRERNLYHWFFFAPLSPYSVALHCTFSIDELVIIVDCSRWSQQNS